MSEIHYLISEASKKVDVEAHVLRYWEEELELQIPRTDMGHRYYTEFHIKLFQQVRDLKEKGYQLKAIKNALDKMLESHEEVLNPEDLFDEEMTTALGQMDMPEESEVAVKRMEQFQTIMNQIVGQALIENNERLNQEISTIVAERVADEMDYQMKVLDEREEARYKRLDDSIRACQREDKSKAEAAASAAKRPLFKFKKKKFARSGKKLSV